MTTITESRPWDLTHLVHFLPSASTHSNPSTKIEDDREPRVAALESDKSHNHEQSPTAIGLGDFAKVWQFLGTPAPTSAGDILHAIPSKIDYASDGATYQSIPHLVEETNVEEAPTLSSATSASIVQPDDHALRRQQKRARQKAKKLAANRITLSESECDGKETPARKASSHIMETRTMITRSMSAKMQAEGTSNEQVVRAVADAAALMHEQLPDTPCPKPKTQLVPPSKDVPTGQELPPASTIATHQAPSKDGLLARGASSVDISAKLPYTTPNVYKRHNLIPSSVQPLQNTGSATAVRSIQTVQNGQAASAVPQSLQKNATLTANKINPMVIRTGEDRHWALLLKIIADFGPDRKHLVSPMNSITHNNDPSGIHVFIDASNIFIGFSEQLKRSRNISRFEKIPDVDMSFDGLALLLERRRPVAKRVLVGSTPHVSAFDTAKAVGYDCSILEKVFKSRELTDRQVYFKEVDRGRKPITKRPPPHKVGLASSVLAPVATMAASPPRYALAGSVLTPGGSGSETDTSPKFAAAKLVEQGVDEILHLKLAESLLDTQEPSTIVLATGDAACAEYSSGFQAFVERALKRGWHVELVSWSKNISRTYRDSRWIAAYGSQFKIIELDDYAEELLEM